jgi:hypothetical protein
VPLLKDDSEIADRGEFQRCSFFGPRHNLGRVEMVIPGEWVVPRTRSEERTYAGACDGCEW